jgi:PIN domain nuclease of toxin-antitoxin system
MGGVAKTQETTVTIYLDTHVVLWLYEGLVNKLPKIARQTIDDSDLLVSPMVRLELQYLHEIKRSKQPAGSILSDLQAQIGLTVCDLPFDQIVRKASEFTWTRDPFDRVIVAQSACRNLRLLTKDRGIRNHTALAFWT